MKSSELRIGNWVEVDGRIDKVLVIYPDAIDCKIDESILCEYMKFVEPIPLTGEWLAKFGFVLAGLEWVGPMCLEQHHGELYYSAGESLQLSIDIKSVHQLQNLYHALTGEELEIKEG